MLTCTSLPGAAQPAENERVALCDCASTAPGCANSAAMATEVVTASAAMAPRYVLTKSPPIG